MPRRSIPGEQVAVPARTGVRADALGSDIVLLADKGRVRWPVGDDPALRKVPPLDLPVARAGVRWVYQVVVGALSVPYLRPVYRGFARIVRAAPSVHARPLRCGFRCGSTADGQGIAASLSARVMRARLCPASRWANIHWTMGAVAGSGSSRRAPPAPRRVRPVRMRASVGELVSVRRPTAQIAALFPGLGGHRS